MTLERDEQSAVCFFFSPALAPSSPRDFSSSSRPARRAHSHRAENTAAQPQNASKPRITKPCATSESEETKGGLFGVSYEIGTATSDIGERIEPRRETCPSVTSVDVASLLAPCLVFRSLHPSSSFAPRALGVLTSKNGERASAKPAAQRPASAKSRAHRPKAKAAPPKSTSSLAIPTKEPSVIPLRASSV